jgi:hypothetical protein
MTAGVSGGFAITGTVVAATRPDHYCEAMCITPEMAWGAGAIGMATIAVTSAISAIVLHANE